jgi:hypothetical protein
MTHFLQKKWIDMDLNRPYHVHSISVSDSKTVRDDLIVLLKVKTKRMYRPDGFRMVPLSSFYPKDQFLTDGPALEPGEFFILPPSKKFYSIIILASTMDLKISQMDGAWDLQDPAQAFINPVPIKQFPLYINYPFVSPCLDHILKGEYSIIYEREFHPDAPPERIPCTIEDWEDA